MADITHKPKNQDLSKADVFASLDKIHRALAPRNKAREKKWAILSAVVNPALMSMGIDVKYIGGNCPLQSEGTFDGFAYYFRARGACFQFHVAPDADKIFESCELFYHEQQYGEWPEAGYMTRFQCAMLIGYCVSLARKELDLEVS